MRLASASRRAPGCRRRGNGCAPQQPWPGGTKTSQPFCCNTRSVAQCVGRNMASATQPTKNATRARFRPTAGRNCGSLRTRPRRRRQQRQHASQPAGHQLQQPQPLGRGENAQPLQHPHRTEQPPHAIGVGKQPQQNQLAEQIEAAFHPLVALLDGQAERLDQPAVADARGTGRFAGPAVQAQFQVSAHAVGQRRIAVGHHSHQLDAAARPVVLVAQLGVGRAGRGAKSAMDAGQQQFGVDARAGTAAVCRGWHGRVARVLLSTGGTPVHPLARGACHQLARRAYQSAGRSSSFGLSKALEFIVC